MTSIKLCNLLQFLALLQLSKTQRRIHAGREVQSDKGYVVYLTKAPKSPQKYDFWICGGSIVTPWYIVTSAACVEDIEFAYAIAGYKEYVPFDQIDQNNCTKTMKKKIVYTCVPKLYELDYAKIEVWSYIDIAVVKVESAYDFNDRNYETLCTYRPRVIEINYDKKYQEPRIDAMVLGWGHQDQWRKPSDSRDYNQKYLQYAATLIHDKNECKQYFSNFGKLAAVIDKYMICTLEAGNINERGDQIIKAKPLADGCTPIVKLLSRGVVECEEDETIMDETRRRLFTRLLERQQNQTRREGICQNDHGGPLVTWVGSHEVLIGVASVFRVTEDSRCTGPYLYTSTQCNGIFLDCVINSGHENEARRALCDKPAQEKGFETVERHISWIDHPDGPADNEILLLRPTKQMNFN